MSWLKQLLNYLLLIPWGLLQLGRFLNSPIHTDQPTKAKNKVGRPKKAITTPLIKQTNQLEPIKTSFKQASQSIKKYPLLLIKVIALFFLILGESTIWLISWPFRQLARLYRWISLFKLSRQFKTPFSAKPAPTKTSWRLNRWHWMSFGLLLLIVGFVYSVKLVEVAQQLPSPTKLSSLHNPTTTEFYDRNDKLLYRLYEGRNRTIITLDQVPQDLVNATIAIEDKHFYQHNGIDISGITRSIIIMAQGGQLQSGSTITQQLIKNTLLTTDRTWQRKTKELVLAIWAEGLYSKQELLQMYFNEVPYGGPAWGIEAAAQTYFNKNTSQLDLAESAYLAGLTAMPTVYSPYGSHPELGIKRQQEVLSQMRQLNMITEQQHQAALSQELAFAKPVTEIKAPHFVMYLRAQLAQKYGEKVVSQGGLKVKTTLDLDIQQQAEKILAEEVAKISNLNVSNGAVMVTDPTNGEILAMVGSKNYFEPKVGNYNVTIANRQPGSAIKPITYVTGFKQGFSPGNILLDTPTSFVNPWEKYTPVNYDGRFHGPVSIRTSLGSSYNIPAVKMLSMVGIPNMISTAQDLGITTFDDPSRYGLSLTLGGGEVKMIDMMSVYGTFASNGMRYPIHGIQEIVDSYGTVVEDNSQISGEQVLEPAYAYMISDILSDNKARTPAFGSNSLLRITGHSVAVKTGTTDLKRDNWTFGYTPKYVVGVWVGNNDNTPMNQSLSSGVTGAAPIWNRVMTALVKDQPDIAFKKPTNVTNLTVDGKKDIGVVGRSTRTAIGMRRTDNPADPDDKAKQTISYTDPFTTLQLAPAN